MTLKIKKLYPDTQLPRYSHDGDAALDVFSRDDKVLEPGERYTFKLGFEGEFEHGYVCLVWDRSGLAAKQGLTCLAGVIDAGFRGEYGVVLFNTSKESVEIKKGDRIAQLLIQPVEQVRVEEVPVLSDSDRQAGGWGSTG